MIIISFAYSTRYFLDETVGREVGIIFGAVIAIFVLCLIEFLWAGAGMSAKVDSQ
jgi:tetrahydromethanopterin S-methyltransferase subunit G